MCHCDDIHLDEPPAKERHGKKTDQETQSPVLKLFEAMMQKEKCDPEKANLLKEKHEKKRRHYSGSRTKIGKAAESSSSDKMKKSHKLDEDVNYQNIESRNSMPFQGEKRESWWFWRDPELKTKTPEEDTYSRLSCGLKKLVFADYACAACVVVVFLVSAVVAFMLLYKSAPCLQSEGTTARNVITPRPEIDRLKRRIDSQWNYADTNPWHKSYDQFDTQDTINRVPSSDSELSNLIDADKLNNIQSNSRLREFYKKLIEADTAIRNLKKSTINSNFDTDFYSLNQDRSKRSIKIFQKPFKFLHLHRKGSKKNKTQTIKSNSKLISKTTVKMPQHYNHFTTRSLRNIRSDSYSIPESFVIEKNKVVVQYKPNANRIVPKCSHAPKDHKSHENELNHPFYKNTQRFDEFLDQLLDKKVPDVISDEFGMDLMIDRNKQCKHKDMAGKETTKDGEYLKKEQKQDNLESKVETIDATTEGSFENEFFDDSDDVDNHPTSSYDVLLSISTLINPSVDKRSSISTTTPSPRINLRKLLEADEKEDENISYDDVKEVLNDNNNGHDDTDRNCDRKKRNDDIDKMEPESKYNNPEVNNPNWKGPMPLYPEELNTMMKTNPAPDRILIPVNSKDVASESDRAELETNDVEYVEDYVDNSYEKLVKLAQAYSDYGVLNDKKDSDSEKKLEKANHNIEDNDKLKLSMDYLKNRLRKSGILPQKEKGSKESLAADALSEGFKIEFHPELKAPSSSSDLSKMLQKHLKFANCPVDSTQSSHAAEHLKHLNPLIPMHSSSNTYADATELPMLSKVDDAERAKTEKEHKILFDLQKRRTIQSIDDSNFKDYSNERNQHDFQKSIIVKRDSDNINITSNKNKSNSVKENQKAKASNAKTAEKNKRDVNNESAAAEKDTELKNSLNREIITANPSSSNATMSDFFSVLSKWFSAFDGTVRSTKTTIAPSVEVIKTSNNKDEVKVATEPFYPQYDSDMNIGHRSRVLMSIEDNASGNTENNDLITTATAINTEITSNGTSATNESVAENHIENSTASIKVKRQASNDNNLIFWNELYDDEYGLNVDPIEQALGDKRAVKKDDLISKSNAWFRNKVKYLSHRFVKNLTSGSGKEKRDNAELYSSENKFKRNRRFVDSRDGKTDFALLTAKMREVCKNTVRDIENMKTVSVREDKQNQPAASLMQNLVQLLSDLVDYQVQERTCRKLPTDLQKFLEWLTSSKSEDEAEAESFSDMSFGDDKSTEQDLSSPSDCLGTLQAVQDLMAQYNDMTEDDKSVMVGVKDYLEQQIDFLERRLAGFSDNNIYNTNDSPRYRRDLTEVTQAIEDVVQDTAHTVKQEYKKWNKAFRKYRKKLKHYSKKVSKTTQSVKKKVDVVTKKIEKIVPNKHQISPSKVNIKNKGLNQYRPHKVLHKVDSKNGGRKTVQEMLAQVNKNADVTFNTGEIKADKLKVKEGNRDKYVVLKGTANDRKLEDDIQTSGVKDFKHPDNVDRKKITGIRGGIDI